jgi:hypothetical protein
MRLALALTTALATVPLTIAAPANATPCTTSTRTIGGTIEGQDGMFVDAMLGFDLMRVTSSGVQHINGRIGSSTYGCAGYHGYGQILRVNPDTPGTGSTTVGSRTWSVRIPANVNQIIVEVYPKAAGPDSAVDDRKYGGALRWKVPIPYGKPIHVKLPAGCGQGGQNGYIAGYAYKGTTKVKLDRVIAWSTAKDNYYQNPILGFKAGVSYSTGVFKIKQLPPGQAYTVIYSYGGKSIQKFGIYVNACKGTSASIRF